MRSLSAADDTRCRPTALEPFWFSARFGRTDIDVQRVAPAVRTVFVLAATGFDDENHFTERLLLPPYRHDVEGWADKPVLRDMTGVKLEFVDISRQAGLPHLKISAEIRQTATEAHPVSPAEFRLHQLVLDRASEANSSTRRSEARKQRGENSCGEAH